MPDRRLFLLIGVALLGALGGYAATGRPDLPAAPAASLLPPSLADRQTFATARTALLADPADIGAWIRLATSLGRMGRTAEAVAALQRALQGMPQSPDLWVAYGEALMAHAPEEAPGNTLVVSPAARLAFDRASQLAPDHPAPRYYLGLSWLHAGRIAEAEATWAALLADLPPSHPFRAEVARKLAAVHKMQAALQE